MPTASRTLLIDSPSLVYRAFHGVPITVRGQDGGPVNAVRGYLDMMATLCMNERPAGLIHALDVEWRPAWRVAIYPGYKAARPDQPAGLPEQFTLLEAVLRAAGETVAGADDQEADDVIATLAERATPERPVSIVSGDRDLITLVRDPAENMLFTVRGVSQLDRFDEAAVRERYGVSPERYSDMAVLRGDPSDGLPGLRGVGPKMAVVLAQQYESIEALIAARGHLPPRVGLALQGNEELLLAMRDVTRMRRDLDLRLDSAGDPAELERLAVQHRLESSVRRFTQARLAPSR
jgi:5'-3' exonuclease